MSTGNPNSPGYEPPGYDAGAPHGGHGHGAEFGVDLFDLYRAGRTYFPETAATYSTVGFSLADCASQLEGQGGLMMSPPPIVGMESLQDELQTAVRSMAGLLERVGETLVTMADDFARTDQGASRSFRHLYDRAKQDGMFSTSTASVRTPPAPDGVHPAAPPVKGA